MKTTESVKETIIGKLSDFTLNTRFEDLPTEVVHESKRIILDSIGCALGGVNSEKGIGGLQFARLMGGRPEATVIGFGDRVSVMAASFANGELINALDFDPILPPGHLTPFMMPAYMAFGELSGCSGKQLVTANAIAHEMSHRVGRAMTNQRDIRDGKVVMPPVMGYSAAIFGGVAGVGKVKGYDKGLLSHALGLAAYICPAQSSTAWVRHMPPATTKYLLAGWMAQSCVTAACLAELGYRGDTQVLDDEVGFYKFMGSSRWDPEIAVGGLGKDWRFPPLQIYKPYPHCRILHGPIDCLSNIIKANDIRPEEIEGITAWVESFCMEPLWANRKIESQVDAQFSVAHCLALVAHRVPPGPEWLDYDNVKDPRILALMDKVTYEVHPDYIQALAEDPRSRLSKVEVRARGRTYVEERRFPKGSPSPDPKTYMTDDELIDKFHHNARRILPWSKAESAARMIMEIEDLDNISELMATIAI